MDVAHLGIVVGYMNGTLNGNAQIAPGMVNNALYMDDQPGSGVNFGKRTEGCFFFPDECDQGITISFWEKLMLTQPKVAFLIENGGCRPNAVGFCIFMNKKFQFIPKFRLKDTKIVSVFTAPSFYKWHLITISHIGRSMTVYVDGCDATPYTSTTRTVLTRQVTENPKFNLGAWSLASVNVPFAIDELNVWYEVLTTDEIWRLYIQGGTVKFRWQNVASCARNVFHYTFVATYFHGWN